MLQAPFRAANSCKQSSSSSSSSCSTILQTSPSSPSHGSSSFSKLSLLLQTLPSSILNSRSSNVCFQAVAWTSWWALCVLSCPLKTLKAYKVGHGTATVVWEEDMKETCNAFCCGLSVQSAWTQPYDVMLPFILHAIISCIFVRLARTIHFYVQ